MKSKTSLEITECLEKTILRFAGLPYPVERGQKGVKKLAGDVKKISGEYLDSENFSVRGLFNEPDLINAYLIYYLPVNLVKLFPILDELVSSHNIFCEDSLSVLDLGCGPGTFTLGFLEYISKNIALFSHIKNITLTGLDQARENVSLASKIINEYISSGPLPSGIRWKVHFQEGSIITPQRVLSESSNFNFIIAGNVLNEVKGENLAEPAKALDRHLSARGALVIIDPGTRRSSRNLIMMRDLILRETSLNLYAPCLYTGTCPVIKNDKEWCHEKSFWNPPEAVKAIDAITGFTKEKGIKYSYLTFVKEKKGRFWKRADIQPEKIWRVASYLIKNKGEERLHVCNGTERIILRRMLRNATEKNNAFPKVKRGDIVCFDGCVSRTYFFDIEKESSFEILQAF